MLEFIHHKVILCCQVNVLLLCQHIVGPNILKFAFDLIHLLYYEDMVELAGEPRSFAYFYIMLLGCLIQSWFFILIPYEYLENL